MGILLDACVFIWIGEDSPKLSETARDMVEDPGSEVLLSVVSVWEMAIKYGLGKLELAKPPEEMVPELRRDYRVQSLGLNEEAVLNLRRLHETTTHLNQILLLKLNGHQPARHPSPVSNGRRSRLVARHGQARRPVTPTAQRDERTLTE